VCAYQKVVLGWYEGKQKVDLSDYVPSGTWDVVECPGKLENKRDPGEQHNRSQITYTLKIRRKTLFYTVNLIIPCVLISLLSVSVFYLPTDAGEKMTMCTRCDDVRGMCALNHGRRRGTTWRATTSKFGHTLG